MTLEPEWPSILRDAPAPTTISAAARLALKNSATQMVEHDLHHQRELCARVQTELGDVQLARYRVAMSENTVDGVPVRVFVPASMRQGRERFVLLNLHGGGFSKDAGSITENVPLAGLTETKVIAVRYRLAPEFPFPAAVDDAEMVYRALTRETAPTNIAVYGTSAGAILSAQLMVRLQRTNCPLPGALGFFSGSADLSKGGDTEHFFRPQQDADRGEQLFASYVDGHDTRNEEVSPLFSDLKRFPPTLCLAGTRDFMLSQTTIFHRALLSAGVEARLVVYEAMLHAHWIYLDIPESTEAFGHMADFFRERLS